MITRQEILKGREVKYPLSPEQGRNLTVLLMVINKVREEWGQPMTVTSGYRPEELNSKIANAAKKSSHTSCQAVDIADPDGKLYAWLTANNNAILIKYDLYLESRIDAPTWCHLQTRPIPSGNRVFRA